MEINSKAVNDESGFTLLELVVVMVVLGIISVVIVNLINRQAETFTRVLNNSDLLSNGRKAIDYLRRDLHGISSGNISTMTSTNLTFQNNESNTITYVLSSSVLDRNSVSLAEYLTSNPFSYLDADQNVTVTAADVVFVKVKLQKGNATESVELEEIIYLRN